MFDPTIGKFINEDPIGFEAGDPNLSRYVGNDPVNKTDPSGMMPNKDDAMTPEKFLERVRELEAKFPDESPSEILVRLRDALKQDQRSILSGGGSGQSKSPPNAPVRGLPWAYVYTKKHGWLDMPHFIEAARFGRTCPDPAVIGFGYGVEVSQSINTLNPWREGAGSSAFTHEDLPSNAQGAYFGDRLVPNQPLSRQLERYFRSVQATNPEQAPGYADLPKNEEQWEEMWRDLGRAKIDQCSRELDRNYEAVHGHQRGPVETPSGTYTIPHRPAQPPIPGSGRQRLYPVPPDRDIVVSPSAGQYIGPSTSSGGHILYE